MPDLSRYSKAIAAVIGAVTILAAQFLPGRSQEIGTVLAALGMVLGVYAAPANTPAPPANTREG